MKYLSFTLNLIVLASLIIMACGRAESDSRRAEVIPAPMSGYTCFAIINSQGETVGGNCVKN